MSELKINKDGKIEISIDAIFESLKKENVQDLFTRGLMLGYFNDLINDLCEGESYDGQWSKTYQLGDYGLESDFLNTIRENIVKKILNLEKASFDVQRDLYEKAINKYGDSCKEIQSLESELKKRDELLREAKAIICCCDNSFFINNLDFIEKVEAILKEG